MDLEWQDVQNRLILVSKDYKCICASIRSIGLTPKIRTTLSAKATEV